MKRTISNIAFAPPVALAVFFLGDIFIGDAHPGALILGMMLAHMLDPIVLLPSLLIGLALRPDWRALAAALAIGAVAELVNMNNSLRVYEGREGFNALYWLTRSLGSCTLITIIAALRLAWQRVAGRAPEVS